MTEQIYQARYLVVSMSALALAGCAGQLGRPDGSRADRAGKCDVVATYDLAFERFDEVAQQIAHGTGCAIVTDLARTGAIRPHSVRGTMSRREAVATALEGTRLRITKEGPDSITVE